jgi:outer membrane protein OmpA-like peptidoglycan-associated protein
MKPLHRLGLASGLLSGLMTTTSYLPIPGPGFAWINIAEAQQPQSEEEKKRHQQRQNQQNQQKQQPPPQQKGPPQPPPQPKGNPGANNQQPPQQPQFRRNFGQPNNPGQGQPPQQGQQPQFKRNFGQPNNPGPGNPGAGNPGQGQPTANQGTPGGPGTPGTPGTPGGGQVTPRFLPKTPPSAGTPGGPPAQGTTPGGTANPQPRFLPGGPGGPPPQGFSKGPGGPGGPGAPTTFMPKRLDEVQGGRQQRVEGNRTIIVEPGNRTIIRQDNRIIIRHDETERFRFGARDVRTARGPGGVTETFFLRPDGTRVVTVTDPSGRLLRRYRRDPYGREINIIDNRRFYRNVAIGVGVGIVGAAILLNLPRPVVDIPRERYIVDYERASDDDLYEALTAPPLMRMERAYSLEEIRDNYSLRERMRSIDLDNITFDSGSFEITPDQYPMLERVARIISRVLERRPDEVFLIEGHTDATGTPEDNLSLSDRRAQAVAQVLSEQFGVPPENLVTQGYGEQYLKIDTPGPERANRRVTVRRISPLMQQEMSDRR